MAKSLFFCESKNVPKIKQAKLDLLNKKDLNKFLKSKEFKESKIAEELIVEYISAVKQSSPAKKMLLINKEIFNKYIKNNSITTKEDVEKLFSISETNQNTIPNLFNKTEREVWYSTESFKKCGINKEEIEQLIEKEQENERIAVEASSNQNSVTQNVIQTESVEYSLETKKPKVYKKVGQTPEEIKMAKMNANYEHDKAVLAKEDPMFAKNQFWDVGHAEGSGEISNRELEKLATLQSEELLEQIKGRDL